MANTQKVQADVKPWYKSKIVVIAGTLFLVFGTNLLSHWMTNTIGITEEQLQAVGGTASQVNDLIERIKGGENVFSLAGVVVALFIAYWRIFATTSLIPQSITKSNT